VIQQPQIQTPQFSRLQFLRIHEVFYVPYILVFLVNAEVEIAHLLELIPESLQLVKNKIKQFQHFDFMGLRDLLLVVHEATQDALQKSQIKFGQLELHFQVIILAACICIVNFEDFHDRLDYAKRDFELLYKGICD
jgi:hypothetical protein